ncbi:hypothetical protein [Sphingomonas daechungensis]
MSGGLLWAYRIAWLILAAATVFALATTLPAGSMQPLVLGIRLVKSAVLIAVAIVLIWRRQRDPVAAILALALLCWTITSSIDFTSAEVWPMLLERLRFLLFAWALLLFPSGRWRPRWTRAVAVASASVFLIGTAEVLGLLGTSIFLPLAIGCVLGAIASLIQRYRTTSSDTLQLQLKWVAFGLVTGIGLILGARAGAALNGPRLAFEAMFQLGIVFVALGFLVPLLRYRLYDAETVISRSAGYAVLTVMLVAVFAGSESLIENLGQQYLGSGIGQVSGAMAAAVAAVLLAPLNERISKWAERRFQRDLVELREQLPDLLAEAPLSWTPRQVGEAVLPRVRNALHAMSAALVLSDQPIAGDGITLKEVAGSAAEFSLDLPLRCPFGGRQGSLLIGPRPDGTAYGKDDVAALEAIAPALRHALLASRQRERDRRNETARNRRLRARLANFAQRLEKLEDLSPEREPRRAAPSARGVPEHRQPSRRLRSHRPR